MSGGSEAAGNWGFSRGIFPADAGSVPVTEPAAPALRPPTQPGHEQRYRHLHHPPTPQLPGGKPRSARRRRTGRGGVRAGHGYVPRFQEKRFKEERVELC